MNSTVPGNADARTARMASQLSPRQREIIELVAEGRTSKEIAVTLAISESTVNWHLANAFERLGASSRAEAVARAYTNGHEPRPQPTPATPKLWPRFIAITIAVAIAAALLGGALVAALRWGPGSVPIASPTNGSDRAPTSTPASEAGADLVAGEIAPATALPLPASSAPPVPSVPVTLSTPAVPSLPVTPPPLPSPSLPVPIPTPSLPVP